MNTVGRGVKERMCVVMIDDVFVSIKTDNNISVTGYSSATSKNDKYIFYNRNKSG